MCRIIAGLLLRLSTKKVPVDPEDWLYIVRRIPAGIKDNDSVGCDQIDAKTAGFRRD